MKIEILQCGSYTSATVTDGDQTTEYRSELGVRWVTPDGTRPAPFALESKLGDALLAYRLWGPQQPPVIVRSLTKEECDAIG